MILIFQNDIYLQMFLTVMCILTRSEDSVISFLLQILFYFNRPTQENFHAYNFVVMQATSSVFLIDTCISHAQITIS